MIKKSIFEAELIAGMQRELQSHDKKQGMENLVKAADYLHSAIEIFEEAGMTAQADKVLKILAKLATDSNDAKKKKQPVDKYTKGLTPEKMLKNLSEHGSVFNMVDDNSADDLLNLDINDADLEVNNDVNDDPSFEDEKD